MDFYSVYLANYDSFDKYMIYDFNEGGIGDLTKFFSALLKICINNNIKLYYLVKNTHVEKYLKLKFSKMYITQDELKALTTVKIFDLIEIKYVLPHTYYIISPRCLYNSFCMDMHGKNRGERNAKMIEIPLNKIFCFTQEVIENIPDIFKRGIEYITLHLRLGDGIAYKYYYSDERPYNQGKIENFIKTNQDKNILFLCDDKKYINSIKCKFNLITTEYDIGHTTFNQTTELQTLNTVSEYYLLTKSKEIYMGSYSGFSITAACFNNVPIYDLEDVD
jgi:hypothetical protein